MFKQEIIEWDSIWWGELVVNNYRDVKLKQDLDLSDTEESVREKISNLIWWDSVLSDEWNRFWKKDVILNSYRIIDSYGFSPLGTSLDFSYLTRVISIDDFSKHPDKYFLKLTDWFWSFPLDFNYRLLSDKFLKNIAIEMKNGKFSFQQSSVFWSNNLSDSLSKALKDIWVSQAWTEWYIDIDILSFLKNYDSFVDFVENEYSLDEKKDHYLNNLKLFKIIWLSIFNTTTNIKVVEPSSFFKHNFIWFEESKSIQSNSWKKIDEDNPFRPKNIEEQEIFLEIEKMLLSTAVWTTNDEINELLRVQNPEVFHDLLDIVIDKIFNDNSLKNTWFKKLDKPLDDFSIDELIAFATYLSRYVIEEYETIEDSANNVMLWFSNTSITWKCTDYTAMSLHIINHYLKPKYKEKFKNIYLWFDNKVVWNIYKHVYIKIYWYDDSWSIVSTFIDPTKLSGKKLEQLTYTKDVYDVIESSNLPIQIDRTVEDLLAAKLMKDSNHWNFLVNKTVMLLEKIKSNKVVNIFSKIFTKQKV